MARWDRSTTSAFEVRAYDGSHYFPVESDLPLRSVLAWDQREVAS